MFLFHVSARGAIIAAAAANSQRLSEQNPTKLTCVSLVELGRTSLHFIVHFDKIPTKKFPRCRVFMIIWEKRCTEYSPIFFPQKIPAPKNNQFRGTFENSIGYVYQEKHVPRCWGRYVKQKLHRLYQLLLSLGMKRRES